MATNGSFKTSAYDSRCLEFSWTQKSSSIANNTTTISWTLKAVGSGQYSEYWAGNFKLLIDGKEVFFQESRMKTVNGTVIKTGEYTFTHGADGKKSFTAYAEAGIYYFAVNCSGSKTFTLDTIPRQATITSAPNFNDEENPTISYSNLAGNSVSALDVCISLNGTTDDIKYRAADKTKTSYTFNLTDDERALLRNATLSGSNSRTVKFHIRTKIGTTYYYHSIQKTFTVINCKPTLSIELWDDNQRSQDATMDDLIYIANFSEVKYKMTAAGVKGASITSYLLEHGPDKYTTASGSVATLHNERFYFKVVDNRGQVSDMTYVRELTPYFKPTCNIDEVESTTDGSMTFNIKGEWFNGNFGGGVGEDNYLAYKWEVYDSSNTLVKQIANSAVPSGYISRNTYSIPVSITGLDYRQTYTIKASVNDYALLSRAPEIRVKTLPVFDWSETDFNFNVPISFNGQEMKDYVIDEGTSNGWGYRLWNSGKAECWRRLQLNTITVNTVWGNMFTSGSLASTNLSYPFTFAELPVLTVSLMPFGSGGLVMPSGSAYGSASQTGAFEIVRGSSISPGQFLLAYHAFGRWK